MQNQLNPPAPPTPEEIALVVDALLVNRRVSGALQRDLRRVVKRYVVRTRGVVPVDEHDDKVRWEEVARAALMQLATDDPRHFERLQYAYAPQAPNIGLQPSAWDRFFRLFGFAGPTKRRRQVEKGRWLEKVMARPNPLAPEQPPPETPRRLTVVVPAGSTVIAEDGTIVTLQEDTPYLVDELDWQQSFASNDGSLQS